jgi:hypothetical protein
MSASDTLPKIPHSSSKSAAAAALAAAGLTVGQITTVIDHTCNDLHGDPPEPGPGTQASPGAPVNLSIGRRPPPPFGCP